MKPIEADRSNIRAMRCIRETSKIKLVITMLGIFLYITGGCDGPQEPDCNPLDPECPNYTLPRIASISKDIRPDKAKLEWEVELPVQVEEDRSLVEYSYRLISNDVEWTKWWEKNTPQVKYAYQLDDSKWLGNGEWSEWADQNFVTFYNLDAGEYEFLVKSVYIGRAEKDGKYAEPSEEKFKTDAADAASDPALMIKPRNMIVSQGKEFKVQVIVEDVTDLMLAHLVLSYEPSILQIQTTEQGDFLAVYGGTVVFFQDVSDLGKIRIDTGVGIGNPPGVSGSGAIAHLKFRALKPGEVDLRFERSSELRSSSNKSITMKNWINGTIHIR